MHAFFMRRCLELAERGRGNVSPNPLVGCVIVAEGWPAGRSPVVLGEGWHEKFGGKHAEVIAIEHCYKLLLEPEPRSRGQATSYKLKEATLFVNLEPCSHHGKTPPCTEAILKAGIKKVVFGARDPLHGSANVLRQHGIEVIGPILEVECRHLNRGFFSMIEQGRPWVTLKKALRRDGTVPSEHVTSEEQNAWAHARLRATHDAILVGSGTVIADNPQLNVRYQVCHAEQGPARSFDMPSAALRATQDDVAGTVSKHVAPRRIVLNPHGEIPATSKVLTDEDSARTLLIREKLPIPELLERLKAEGITSVLVEGGPRVWKVFEESRCVDEVVTLVGVRRRRTPTNDDHNFAATPCPHL